MVIVINVQGRGPEPRLWLCVCVCWGAWRYALSACCMALLQGPCVTPQNAGGPHLMMTPCALSINFIGRQYKYFRWSVKLRAKSFIIIRLALVISACTLFDFLTGICEE